MKRSSGSDGLRGDVRRLNNSVVTGHVPTSVVQGRMAALRAVGHGRWLPRGTVCGGEKVLQHGTRMLRAVKGPWLCCARARQGTSDDGPPQNGGVGGGNGHGHPTGGLLAGPPLHHQRPLAGAVEPQRLCGRARGSGGAALDLAVQREQTGAALCDGGVDDG